MRLRSVTVRVRIPGRLLDINYQSDIIGSMIRTREHNYPPPYQIELAKGLAKSDKELALKVLKAEPLQYIVQAEFTNERKPIHTSWHEQPVFYVEQGDRIFKVLYANASEHGEYKYERADKYGNAQAEMKTRLDRYGRVESYFITDLGENDTDYHIFWCSDFNFFLKKLASGQEVYTLLFDDIRSGRTFITQIYQMSLSI